MAELVWTDPALSQLQEIMDYVSRNSVAAAEKLGNRLVEAPEILRLMPEIGGRVPEFDIDVLRELIVRPYRIVYLYREEECSIIAVVHGSRDLPSLLRPEDLESI